jgi:DNA/RNA endonuclease YhcR with UshA esterase domain
MMNDKQIIRICLIGSVICIIAIYFIALQMGSQSVKVVEITGDFSGRVVNVTGDVSNVYLHKNGHVFFNLNEGRSKIRVVVWESIVEQLSYSGVNISKIKSGERIQIVGTVEMYQGEPEIIPLRAQVWLV